MTPAIGANTTEAESAFVVSSTPEFLLTRLSRLDSARFISVSYDADLIYKAVEDAIVHPPADLSELVRPLLLLVALSKKDAREHLRRELGKQPAGYRWYPEIVSLLCAGTTTFRDIQVPPNLSVARATPLDTTTVKIILPRK